MTSNPESPGGAARPTQEQVEQAWHRLDQVTRHRPYDTSAYWQARAEVEAAVRADERARVQGDGTINRQPKEAQP